MKQNPPISILILLLLGGLFTACQPAQKKEAVKEEKPVVSEALVEPSDPRFNSSGENLGEVSVTLASVSPSDPVIPGDLKTPIAYMGALKYTCQGKDLLVWKRDTPSWPPQEGDSYGSQPWLRYGAPERITAGPLVFQDVILVATAKPAFIVLDRHDLTVRQTVPLDHVPLGPLTYDPGKNQISVFLGDGSLGSYSLKPEKGGSSSKESVDPLDLLIKPEPPALSKIEAKTAQLLSKEGPFEFSLFAPYRPGIRVPQDTALLCRYEITGSEQKNAGETLRLYVDGASERPYLIAIFYDTGELMASNIEYSVSKVLEAPVEANRPYFVAVSFLISPETFPLSPPAHFVIVPRGL